MNNVNVIDEFVNRLLEEKGVSDLDPEVVEQMKKDLASRVEDHINVALVEQLSPEKLEEFEKILKQSDAQSSQEFLSQNIPDLNQVVGDALLRFRIIYIGA